jgi:hypothetical protein
MDQFPCPHCDEPPVQPTHKNIGSSFDELFIDEEEDEPPVEPTQDVIDAFGPQGIEKEAIDWIKKTVKRAAAKEFHPDTHENGAEMMAEIMRLVDDFGKYHYNL